MAPLGSAVSANKVGAVLITGWPVSGKARLESIRGKCKSRQRMQLTQYSSVMWLQGTLEHWLLSYGSTTGACEGEADRFKAALLSLCSASLGRRVGILGQLSHFLESLPVLMVVAVLVNIELCLTGVAFLT